MQGNHTSHNWTGIILYQKALFLPSLLQTTPLPTCFEACILSWLLDCYTILTASDPHAAFLFALFSGGPTETPTPLCARFRWPISEPHGIKINLFPPPTIVHANGKTRARKGTEYGNHLKTYMSNCTYAYIYSIYVSPPTPRLSRRGMRTWKGPLVVQAESLARVCAAFSLVWGLPLATWRRAWSVRHPCGCGRLPFEAFKPWLRPADKPNPPWAGILLGFACLGGVSLCRMCYRSAPFSRHVPHPLCCTHDFGSFLSTPVKNVLHPGTFAEAERYLPCTTLLKNVLAYGLLQSQQDICAISLPCTTLLKKVFDSGTFAEPDSYLCNIFAVHMTLGVLSQSC